MTMWPSYESTATALYPPAKSLRLKRNGSGLIQKRKGIYGVDHKRKVAQEFHGDEESLTISLLPKSSQSSEPTFFWPNSKNNHLFFTPNPTYLSLFFFPPQFLPNAPTDAFGFPRQERQLGAHEVELHIAQGTAQLLEPIQGCGGPRQPKGFALVFFWFGCFLGSFLVWLLVFGDFCGLWFVFVCFVFGFFWFFRLFWFGFLAWFGGFWFGFVCFKKHSCWIDMIGYYWCVFIWVMG